MEKKEKKEEVEDDDDGDDDGGGVVGGCGGGGGMVPYRCDLMSVDGDDGDGMTSVGCVNNDVSRC